MSVPNLPAIVLGIVLAPILLLAPGYFWSRLLGLGPVSRSERAAWGLVLSLATSPILAYNFFLLVPYNAWTVWAFALLQTALPATLGRLLHAPRPASEPVRFPGRRWWIFPALLALFAVSCVMDVEWRGHLYRGIPAVDYAKHVIVTDAIHRTGVHPVNPAFHPERPLPLFFYFFWFLLCSMLDGLTFWGLGPRAAVEAMTAWGAVSLFALVLLLLSGFARPFTRRLPGICFALILAGGVDLVGFAFFALVDVEPGKAAWRKEVFVHPGVDGWNWMGKVMSWPGTAAWVPHHLAALVVSMTGFLVVFALPPSSGGVPRPAYQWTRAWIFAACAASSLGLSVWVTLVFGGFWLLWAVVAARRRWWEDLRLLVRATLPALLLASPFLYILSQAWVDKRFPLVFDVRNLALWNVYADGLSLKGFRETIDLVLLLPGYFLELGIFFLGGLFWWNHRRRPLEKRHLALVLLAATSAGMVSFLRSNLENNDFGWRGFLPAQLVLLLATGWMLERLWRLGRRPPLVISSLVLGFAATPVDWVVMTVYPAIHDLSDHHGAEGRRNWAMQRFYEQIRAATPGDAIVQQNPFVTIAQDHALYAGRQSVVLDQAIGTVFGAQGYLFVCTRHEVSTIFEADTPAREIEHMAGKYHIAVVVLQKSDPGWHSPVWEEATRFRLLARCDFARAYELIQNPDR